jgi:hypothetical protein
MRLVTRTSQERTLRIDSADRTARGADSAHSQKRARLRLFFAMVGIFVAVAAGIIVWESGLKYRFTAKRWGVVVPGKIYRSGQISRWVLEKQLAAFQIAEVIDLNGIEPEDLHQAYEIKHVPQAGLVLHRFPLGGDGRGDIRRYADAIETLVRAEKAGRPILVHCSAGAQRTGGVVACYRVFIQRSSPQAALAELENFGFRPERDTELVPYLNENVATLAEMLVERGVIERVPNPLPTF